MSRTKVIVLYLFILFLQYASVFFWVMSFGFGYAVVFGPYISGYKNEGDHFNKTENVAYGALNEFTWSLAVAWVLYACHNGFAGKKILIKVIYTAVLWRRNHCIVQ